MLKFNTPPLVAHSTPKGSWFNVACEFADVTIGFDAKSWPSKQNHTLFLNDKLFLETKIQLEYSKSLYAVFKQTFISIKCYKFKDVTYIATFCSVRYECAL